MLKQKFIFDNFDAFAEQMELTDAVYSQLKKGAFLGQLIMLALGPVTLYLHKMNQTILQQGKAIKGHTSFLIPMDLVQHVNWRKHTLRGYRIGIIKEGMEHQSVSMPNFYALQVLINNEYLHKLLAIPEFDSVSKVIRFEEVVEIDTENAKLIHRLANRLFISKQPDLELLSVDLPLLILDSVNSAGNNERGHSTTSRNLSFYEAVKYINQNIDEKIHVQDICKVTGMSERSLRYIFQDIAGMPPLKYASSLRLNKIRGELKKYQFDEKINSIAHQWGIWHSGQFAADYKRLFDELPSDTLKK